MKIKKDHGHWPSEYTSGPLALSRAVWRLDKQAIPTTFDQTDQIVRADPDHPD